LDRFGTKLEKRYTKQEIKKMLKNAGFKNIRFSNNTPYWVAIAWKK
jgi:ubiquinone/menaquinone biosynthesis C-methylase UbiE